MDTLGLPATVEHCLNRYRGLLDQYVPQLLAALYVHGSIALGAYDEGKSDIDFIAVLSKAANDGEISALKQIHRTLTVEFPHSALEGSYLQMHDLGRSVREIAPSPCIYDGQFHPVARHDINPVTWWMLKHRAIIIFGPNPVALPFEAEWDAVHAYMRHNLNTYWAAYTTSLRRMAFLLSDAGVEWAVLGVSRLYYGLREGTMISKRQAGEYAMQHMPVQWHALLQETLALRAGQRTSLGAGRVIRARQTQAFIKAVIAASNAF